MSDREAIGASDAGVGGGGFGDLPAGMPPSAEQLARRIAELAVDKKAVDVQVLDLRAVAGFTDFFVICGGTSDRHVKSVHDAIRVGIKRDLGIGPEHTEGEREARWILLDYGDCVAHVMTSDAREFYRLEHLWADAARVPVDGG